MLLGCLILGACYLALSWLGTLWQFYLLYFVIGVGYSVIGPVTVGVAISNWFSRCRGAALGPVLAGYIFDVTGAYTLAFVPGIALILLAALAVSTEVLPAETTA